MTAAMIVQLLVTFGPGAIAMIDTLINKWSSNAPVTPQEWAALRVLATQSAKDRMLAQLSAAGIAADSPQGIAMLALVGN